MRSINPTSQKIGALLLERGLINVKDIEKALVYQQQFKGRFGAVLVRIGAISEDALFPVLVEQLSLNVLESEDLPADPEQITAAIQMSGLSSAWFQD